jgi:hypothetical protein
MRLVDFCNPHFKDEHPSRAWIPALFTLGAGRFHATLLASLGLASAQSRLLTTTEPGEPKL